MQNTHLQLIPINKGNKKILLSNLKSSLKPLSIEFGVILNIRLFMTIWQHIMFGIEFETT